MSSRSGATPSTCWPTIWVSARFASSKRIARIDDALFRRIVEGLCLVHVAARADAGLLARLGLVQQRVECFALGDVGGKLIGGGQDAEVGLRHSQQQTLLRALEIGLRRGDLEIRFLQLAEGLETPQRLRHVETQGVRRAVAVLRARGGADGAIGRLAAERRPGVESGAFARRRAFAESCGSHCAIACGRASTSASRWKCAACSVVSRVSASS